MACEITVGSSLKDISFVNSDIIAALESNSIKLYRTDTSRRIMTIGCEEETKQLHGANTNCFLIQYTGIRILKISTGQLIMWHTLGESEEIVASHWKSERLATIVENKIHKFRSVVMIDGRSSNGATSLIEFDKWRPIVPHSINDNSLIATSETGSVKLLDFGKSNKPISTTPVLDRIKAVEDVGQFNFCVIADSKVLLMDSTLGKKKMSIDMKANEKCVGVLSGNAKAPFFMVLKDERKKEILSSDLFNFQRTIARGTFGEVKEYTSIRTGRSFAIKELRRSHALNEIFINDQNHMLIKHKHIVRFFGAFKDESTIFIVLELMSQTLRQVMRSNGIMDEASSGVVVKAVAKGLQHLHRLRVIHRDLKPENILLSHERIKIGDFGLATTKTGETWCGTPGYQAPELFRKETHGTPADMFSLGVMAHEMLESSLPFSEQYWHKHVIRSNTLQYVSPAKFSRHLKTLILREHL
ncbi:hypothetical protein GCK72_005042 [Caenorhabditis remanei]|uniref:Protein kinase domain-containing protein n=1 Tax=Caenorhabditis remanei TaxID=31234 RepID=A0A6A5HBE9_CAERE|nr:hypothetical protein GCK72_005042 [Caenorhabditis remanei]KAF1765090.1 hypothetical protein GCK72_005042 [Caenorhabditis remanei]